MLEPSCDGADWGLVGRQRELELISRFGREAASAGSGLILSGEPGSGKTVLLDVAARVAHESGAQVLRAAGTELERSLKFSGLHSILAPLLPEIGGLSPVHRDALHVSMGLSAGPVPTQMIVSNATMVLFRRAALARPVVVTIDDGHWFDPASLAVLTFTARRRVARVGFLWAIRSGGSRPIERSGMPMHTLEPLTDDAAGSLLDLCFPSLVARVRQRLIFEARGNPLALIDLPLALSATQLAAVEALPTPLPLTPRLQGLHEERIAHLPERTRRALLLAALDSTGDLRVLQMAARTSRLFDDLASAEREHMISVDDVNQQVIFRHPLIRSTVVQLSTGGERREAHRALADAVLEKPDLRARHLAEASLDPDEQVASMLDEATSRLAHRGDVSGAAASAIRALRLSPKSTERARRLAIAAYYSVKSGETRTGLRLLDDARQVDPNFAGSLGDAVVSAFLLLLVGEGHVSTAHQLLVDALRSHPAPFNPHDKIVTEAVHLLARVCWLGGNAEMWQSYMDIVSRFSRPVPASFMIVYSVLADPTRVTVASLTQLEHSLVALRQETDPTTIWRVSMSARYVDRLNLGEESFHRIVHDPNVGALGTCGLQHLALHYFFTGQWDESERLANYGLTRELERQHRMCAGDFQYILALLAAARGDDNSNRDLCDELTGLAVPRGALNLQYASLRARALNAIGRGDFEQAYQFAAAVSAPGMFRAHVGEAVFVCMDLVEAAVRTGRLEDAEAHVAAMNQVGIAALSPRLAMIAAGSAALVSPWTSATELFEQALAVPGSTRWPFDRARVQLAYGEHLRRTRSTSLARTQLKAAFQLFKRIGAQPWASRAGNELRATGQVMRGDNPGGSALTPQERQTAELAASGLSNRQIAERLYLSPRTVGNHLHRVYPKLGIVSRAGLRDALTSAPWSGEN